MISPFDGAPGHGAHGRRREGAPGLLSERGGRGVADLIARAGAGREITKMLFPEIDESFEPHQEGSECAELAAEVETLNLAEMELGLRISAAREEAQREARAGFEVELAGKLAEERRRVDRIRVEFARDRQRFFAAAEGQVVRLALAVASRVLAREVAGDGLALRATVKAALGRVQESSVTSLRVPAAEAEAWTAMLQRGAAGKVQVLGDETLGQGECEMETTVGRVELGIDVQMEEIGRGFGELLQVDLGQSREAELKQTCQEMW